MRASYRAASIQAVEPDPDDASTADLERILLIAQIAAQVAAVLYLLWLAADDDWMEQAAATIARWWRRTVLAQRLAFERSWRRQIGPVIMEAMTIVEDM